MVEKFNFYDIYGYLIPGLFLTGLLWLPFGVVWHVWPKAEFSSAILVLLFAYILGHFLQSLRVPTSDMPDRKGCWRHPSNVLLDEDDVSLAKETKKKIRKLSEAHFELKLESAEDTDHRREKAFFQARSALLKTKGDKTSVYWEQFEGLYAMTRNIMRASALGVFYFLGWGVKYASHADRIFAPIWLALALLAAAIFSVARAPRKDSAPALPNTTATHHDAAAPAVTEKDARKNNKDHCAEKNSEEIWNRRLAWAFAISLAFTAFFGGGLIARATTTSQTPEQKKASFLCCTPCPADSGQQEAKVSIDVGRSGWTMFMLALAAALASGWAYRAYKEFAKQFALAIWQDFANFAVLPPQPPA